MNSGFYNPIVITIPKINGIFMVNQNGNIFAEARVIKKADNVFLIEYMSSEEERNYYRNYQSFL
jgi:hypothetical protein